MLSARRWIQPIAGAVAVACTLATTNALGHGDAHLLIADLNRQLEARPNDASLFFRRAELYRLDGGWTNALVDLDRAARLDPKLQAVDLERGRVFLDAGQPERATNHLNRFLANQPTHAVALVTRARSFAWLGLHRAAVDDFTAAIRASPAAGPDLYLERAAASRACGPDRLPDALAGLQAAINTLGPVMSLESAALDLEVELERWDDALRRLDRLAGNAARKDRWLIRRADVLEAAGRLEEARTTWSQARVEFEALPERMRTTPAGRQEAARLKTALDTPSAK